MKGKNKGSGLLEDKHINKKFASKHYELADLYLSYNRYDEALFEFNKVVGLDPENLEARIKISKVYAKKGFVVTAQLQVPRPLQRVLQQSLGRQHQLIHLQSLSLQMHQ